MAEEEILTPRDRILQPTTDFSTTPSSYCSDNVQVSRLSHEQDGHNSRCGLVSKCLFDLLLAKVCGSYQLLMCSATFLEDDHQKSKTLFGKTMAASDICFYGEYNTLGCLVGVSGKYSLVLIFILD